MIRPLRIRHRRIFTVLGVLLPVALGLGIAARKPVPTVVALPPGLGLSAPPTPAGDWERTDIFANVPVRIHVLSSPSVGMQAVVRFSIEENFARPDLLAYWVAGNPAMSGRLPDDSVLMGAAAASSLSLPEAATRQEGVIVLYSLADNEIVDVSRPVRLGGSTR